MSTTLSPGQKVYYRGDSYLVGEVDGKVIELRYLTGAFFRFVHITCIEVEPVCTPLGVSPGHDPAGSCLAARGECSPHLYRQAFFRAPGGMWLSPSTVCAWSDVLAPRGTFTRSERRT